MAAADGVFGKKRAPKSSTMAELRILWYKIYKIGSPAPLPNVNKKHKHTVHRAFIEYSSSGRTRNYLPRGFYGIIFIR
jgi:hypothetical protein